MTTPEIRVPIQQIGEITVAAISGELNGRSAPAVQEKLLPLVAPGCKILLDMRDVYWTREGLLSVQVTLATGAAMGAAILTIRILGRGELRQERAGEIPAQPHPFAGRGAVPHSSGTA